MKPTIAERIAETVADKLLLKLEYDPTENDLEYLNDATKHLDITCEAFRRIGAKIQINHSIVSVTIDGQSAEIDADEL